MSQDGNGHWFMSATIKARIEMVVQQELIQKRGASQKQIEEYFGIGAMVERMTTDFDEKFGSSAKRKRLLLQEAQTD